MSPRSKRYHGLNKIVAFFLFFLLSSIGERECSSSIAQGPGQPKRPRRQRSSSSSSSRRPPTGSHGRAVGDPPPRPVHRRRVAGAVPRPPPPRRQPGHGGNHRYSVPLLLPPISPSPAFGLLHPKHGIPVNLFVGFVIGEGDIPAATAEDVELAVSAARDAFGRDGGRHWSRAPGAVRAKYLKAIAAKVLSFYAS